MNEVDLLRPSTWIRYKPSLCKGCWAGCCTMPVVVNPEDLFHMGYLNAQEVNGPLKRIAGRLIKLGVVKTYREKSRSFVLRQRKNHDCIFLDRNRMCTIYDRRPAVCREFPMNSKRAGFCPRKDK